MPLPFTKPGFDSSTSQTTIGIAFFLSLFAMDAHGSDVRVYSEKHVPLIASQTAVIIYMDAAQELEAGLTADLPADPVLAESLLRQRLQDNGLELQHKLATAYQGIAEAWGLGIAKIPAVVVDRRYVVYGEPNVALAVDRIEAYRRAHP